MFQSATLRLTLWYLAIAMTISICFSAVIYNVATHELDRGLHRQSDRFYAQIPDDLMPDPRLRSRFEIESEVSAHRLLLRLIGLNLIVLGGAGYASYILARRTLEPIAAAHEQQKRFTADVSHELRTPLTALKMESEVALLNPKAKPADLRNTIKSNLEEASKLELLINNLLRLSRLEADELQQQFTTVNSSDVLHSAITQVKPQADAKKIHIDDTTKPHKIWGDSDSLQQLFVILLDNAIKYSNHGQSIKLTSRIKRDYLTIKIVDEGSGIEPAALEHVFDRFYRADSSRHKGDSTGFGLGLSIAKMIADVHNGDITITSKVNKGTSVSVNLPLPHSDDQPAG